MDVAVVGPSVCSFDLTEGEPIYDTVVIGREVLPQCSTTATQVKNQGRRFH